VPTSLQLAVNSMAAPSKTVLGGVGQTLVVMSGKGGVGKSTTTVQLALALQAKGKKVGILDVDLCGPSIPRMLGVEDRDVLSNAEGSWMPVFVDETLSVLSIAFFLNSKQDAIIWRGPKKNSMIMQLLTKVCWSVDFLLIDTPPGTSDEHISVMENILNCAVLGAVMVTTPQMMSIDDVTRQLTFCRRTGLPVVGLVENMAGYVCPNCKECSNPLALGGGEEFAQKAGVPFLGRVPIDPRLVQCTEEGKNFIQKFSESPIAKLFGEIADNIINNKLGAPTAVGQNNVEMEEAN